MFHYKWYKIGYIVALIYCSFFYWNNIEAKPSKNSGKKKDVSILKKGWGDVNTRNNYYFNAKRIYDEMLKEHERNSTINYQDTLPFYFHDYPPSFASNEAQLQKIIVKTGVVLQRHDYSRWKDDCYTLLGKAHFLKGSLDSALVDFQYVSTALRGKFNNKKAAISQKAILKAKVAKQKELNKIAKDKKKELEQKEKSKNSEIAKSAEDKKKRMEAVAKAKEKELQQKIKAKEKMLKQKAKGKYKPPSPSAVKTTPTKTTPTKKKKSVSGILDKISEGVSIEVGSNSGSQSEANKADKKVKALLYTKEKLEAGNVVDTLTQKQKENIDKLTLWEKIKHLQSRPEALVWMTKTLIKQRNFSDAESIVEYSKTLIKLRKKQRKDVLIVNAYYYYNKGQIKFAAQALEESIPYIKKKKEKNYYNYLLAQLSSQSDPQRAYDIYKSIYEKGKDEVISYNALEMMNKFVSTQKVDNQDSLAITKGFNKFAKSKIVGDKALYTLSEISLQKADTSKAIQQLEKALTYNFSSPDQKGKALVRLGDISYEKHLFKEAYVYYDSAQAKIQKDTLLKNKIVTTVKSLKQIIEEQDLAFQQDSLIYLSTLSREDLAMHVKAQNKSDRKLKRKEVAKNAEDASFSSTGIGSSSNFNVSQEQYTAKGQWYFYNIDMRSKGFTEFKQIWGERPYVNNWRRGEAIMLSSVGFTEEMKQKALDTITNIIPKAPIKIPSTKEEVELANDIIAKTYLVRGKLFFHELKNYSVALLYLDSLLSRYPEQKLIPEALYNKILIYSEMNKMNLAKETTDSLLNHFPEHELSQKIIKNREVKYVRKDEKNSSQAEDYYNTLYQLFLEGQFSDVLERKLFFYEKYSSDKTLLKKVDFLAAVSLGKLGQYKEYKTALENIIQAYPKSIEAEQVKLYLKMLIEHHQDLADKEIAPPTPSSTGIFKVADGYHFIIMLLEDRKQNNAKLVEAINEEMDKDFPNQRIRGSNSYLDAKTALLLIKRFENIEDAKKGVSTLNNSKNLTIREALINAEILLISQDNFKELFTGKKLDDYKIFYQENY
ncbi:MAG: tetratricopeptide repeat protein [Chitinophagales bacterium]|nr:tetratricopeptide repeat protein [Chitinophagales bacterium]